MDLHIRNVAIDCNDLETMTAFWQALTGYAVASHDDQHTTLRGTDGRQSLYLQRVPEPRVGKNRLHLDLTAADVERAAEAAVGAGADRLRRFDNAGDTWIVLRDPEGNILFISQVGWDHRSSTSAPRLAGATSS